MEEKKHKKFKFKTPHTYALLMFVIFLAWLLTYIIPAGEYAREKKSKHLSFQGLTILWNR